MDDRHFEVMKILRVISFALYSTVSAPGKALIAGGYLVLERENVGYTVAVSSRFYSTVKMMVRS